MFVFLSHCRRERERDCWLR